MLLADTLVLQDFPEMGRGSTETRAGAGGRLLREGAKGGNLCNQLEKEVGQGEEPGCHPE